MEPVNLRNLDQIQEEEPGVSRRLGTLVLVAIAASVFVVVGVATREGESSRKAAPDPLAELVAEAQGGENLPAERIGRDQVTFPSLLSDSDTPTTALAAVKDEDGKLVPWEGETSAETDPPPPADDLRVVPLPLGDELHSTPVTREPKDELTRMAVKLSETSTDELAPPGAEGGYQIQVASFQDPKEAELLVEQLRQRAHRAYRVPTEIRGRGLWHRVRIGPFKTLASAQAYKTEFEAKERLNTFLVDPHKVKRREDREREQFAARKKQLEAQTGD